MTQVARESWVTAYQTANAPVSFKPDVSMQFHFIVAGNKKGGLMDQKTGNQQK